ncbi:hypothetical protein WR25_01684 [Diploscapter pachys]|uniref:Uncharacterized protein n=1 Tax=Diploscapter pachys TaxID=2018661 RepID=A0A2A2JSH6_9BILA|nr:hypothetical protein WR25_01684 [Diploscapter pachys]
MTKAKRKLSFSSPLSINTSVCSSISPPALKSPRNKRRKGDKTVKSPKRRRSVGEVRPPPEFIPFNYQTNCPEFTRLLDTNESDLDGTVLTNLQHELEAMLVHAADYQRRAYGEVTFLQTGEYPVQDLRNRPMPRCKLRQQPSVAQMSPLDILHANEPGLLRSFKSLLLDKLQESEYRSLYENTPWKYRCGVPAPAASRLRSGSTHQSPSTSRHHVKIGLGDQRIKLFRIDDPVNMFTQLADEEVQSTSRESPAKVVSKRESKEEEDDGASGSKCDEQWEVESERQSRASPIRTPRASRSSCGGNATGAGRSSPSKEKEKHYFAVPQAAARRQSGRLASKEVEKEAGHEEGGLTNGNRKLSITIKNEPLDVEMEEDEEFSPYLRSGTARIVSPRTKKELREDDEWGEGNKCNYVNGHGCGTFGNGITTNGAKKNGDYKRNGELKCNGMNGISYGGIYENGHANSKKKKAPRSPNKIVEQLVDDEYENSEGVEEEVVEPRKLSRRLSNGVDKYDEDDYRRHGEEERTSGGTEELNADELLGRMETLVIDSSNNIKQEFLQQFGAKVTRHLIAFGIIPEEAAESYEELIIKNFYDEIVSEEGRDLTDNREMDEVSVELLRYQYDLRDTEIQLRGLTQAIWRKLREDFATWTLSEQLDDACYDLFRLAVNMYREAPNRRLPQASEQPILMTAVEKRKQKARAYYGNRYVEQPPFHSFNNTRRPEKDPMMCPTANPRRMVPKWMRPQVPNPALQNVVPRQEWAGLPKDDTDQLDELPPPIQDQKKESPVSISPVQKSTSTPLTTPITKSESAQSQSSTKKDEKQTEPVKDQKSESTKDKAKESTAPVVPKETVDKAQTAVPEQTHPVNWGTTDGGKKSAKAESADTTLSPEGKLEPDEKDDGLDKGYDANDKDDKEDGAVEVKPILPKEKVKEKTEETNQSQSRADRYQSPFVDDDESSSFTSVFLVITLLVICLFLLQHNKKRILGLLLEGRSSGSSRRSNIRYRRLSQDAPN